MSENIPETSLPSPDEFDLDTWLGDTTYGRPEHSVVVYRDLSLMADVEEIQRQIEHAKAEAKAAGDDSLAGDGRSDLESKAEALLEKMESVKLTVRVRGLIEPEVDEILKRTGEKSDEITVKTRYEILASAVAYPRLTPSQWAKMHQVIGNGQFAHIWLTYLKATNGVPDVSAPFSRKS